MFTDTCNTITAQSHNYFVWMGVKSEHSYEFTTTNKYMPHADWFQRDKDDEPFFNEEHITDVFQTGDDAALDVGPDGEELDLHAVGVRDAS
jgi:hypothetical protein